MSYEEATAHEFTDFVGDMLSITFYDKLDGPYAAFVQANLAETTAVRLDHQDLVRLYQILGNVLEVIG